ncbi:MAG: hypothetical protein JEZ04_01945 [Spirochaetales bacterium]|nr:hypothetical protein [Spirochaetales bacterium]
MSKNEKEELIIEIEKLRAVSRTTLDPEKVSAINSKIKKIEKIYLSMADEKNKPEQ